MKSWITGRFQRSRTLLFVLFLFLSVDFHAWSEPDSPDQGVQFDGKTQAAKLPAPGRCNSGHLSIAIRVKLRSHRQPQVIVNRGKLDRYFALYLAGDQLRMQVEYEEGKRKFAHASLPAKNKWTHLVGTYDGNHVRLYVNGKFVDGSPAKGQLSPGYGSVYVGAESIGRNVLDGSVADVRFYPAALTPEEVRSVANGHTLTSTYVSVEHTTDELRRFRTNREPDTYPGSPDGDLPTMNGFYGIWYNSGPSGDKYKYKYSGGLGTYPAKHHPFAVYDERSNKTFFVYGGSYPDNNRLLHMISYYDHDTGNVARPRVLLDKKTEDPHDNPTIAMDDEGHLWIFSNAHGPARPSFILQSTRPRDITSFKTVKKTNFSYGQPYYLPRQGFVFLHTKYGRPWVTRRPRVMRSQNGTNWSSPKRLTHVAKGHYQISWPKLDGKTIGTGFNYHPADTGLDGRTNLYYMESSDAGQTWHNIHGQTLELPLTEPENPALAIDYRARGRNVYLKEVRYDRSGRPVLLIITSEGYQAGPANDPRWFTVVRWTGSEWTEHKAFRADNNYDYGSLYLRARDDWRVIAATRPSPQAYNTGGEIGIWQSTDRGKSWEKIKQVTKNSNYNHNYPRRPLHYNDDFAAFWQDGNARKFSDSRLYFTDIDGNAYRLPTNISEDKQMIEPVPLSE